jgi:hypothetical protein
VISYRFKRRAFLSATRLTGPTRRMMIASTMPMRTLLASVLPVVVACALGCSSRRLDPNGSGTLDRDGGGGAGAAGGQAGAIGAGGDVGTTGAGGATGAGGESGDVGAGGSVAPPLPTGRRCSSAGECASGFCADGVCCVSACTDPCWSCNQEVTAGLCLLLPAGAAPKVASACPATAPSTCGTDGTCNGAGSCRLHPSGTPCAPGSCSGRTAVVGQQVCNGRGTCQDGPAIICVPYACDPATAACRTACVTDDDCEGSRCVDGRCPIRQQLPRCTQNVQCASGSCADGYCCDTACNRDCQSCDVPGREGTCSPRPDLCPGADAGGA